MSDLEDWKQDIADDYDVTTYQREEANRDIRFIGVTGGMWEDYLTNTHDESSQRARLEFDMTSDYVMRFVGEQVTNRAGVIFEPDDVRTSDEDAELLTGVYRGDFRENGGKAAQDNAIYEAAICGMGAIQLSEKFVDEEDPENDQQEIIWKTVYNAFDHVMFDANAKSASKCDAMRVSKLTGFNKKTFNQKYPDIAENSAFTPTTTYNHSFDWYTEEQIFVAERYEVKKEKEEVQVWEHQMSGEVQTYRESDMEKVGPELKALGWTFVRNRKITHQYVEKSIFTGSNVIQEPKRIAGRFLPIIPVYAYRVFINGKEHYWGLVRKLKDGNRTVNTLVSKLAETSAASAADIPIFVDEQVDGKEGTLADNTNKPYQVINKVVDQSTGQQIPMGPVGQISSPSVDQSAMAALASITEFMNQYKGGAQQDTLDPDTSGKALNAWIKRANMNTKVIDENIIKSLTQVGKVYESKAGDLYTVPMMKKVIGIDGTVRVQQLNKLSLDPKTANPINTNDLSRGRYSVNIDVGPQYETEQEATVESIERFLERIDENNPLWSTAVSMWVENINGTGLEPLKRKNRKQQILAGDIDPETDEEKEFLQQAQSQQGNQDRLSEAAAFQMESEGIKMRSDAQLNQTKAIQNLATAEKTKTDAAKNIVDINEKLGEQAASRALMRFAKNARITG